MRSQANKQYKRNRRRWRLYAKNKRGEAGWCFRHGCISVEENMSGAAVSDVLANLRAFRRQSRIFWRMRPRGKRRP